jgi:hypothetical protein
LQAEPSCFPCTGDSEESMSSITFLPFLTHIAFPTQAYVIREIRVIGISIGGFSVIALVIEIWPAYGRSQRSREPRYSGDYL